MEFEIPANIGELTIATLKAKAAAAKVEYDTLYASVTPDTVQDEDLDALKALHEFVSVTVPNEIAGRERRSAEFATLGTQPDGDEGDSNDDSDGDEGTVEEPSAVTASATPPATAQTITVTLQDIIKATGGDSAATMPTPAERPRYSTLVAAAGVPNTEAGQPFADLLDVAKAFNDRTAGFSGIRGGTSGQGPTHYPVATLRREYPEEFSINDMDEWGTAEKLAKVADEKRLPGGSLLQSVLMRQKQLENTPSSLVAAAGWCAPSETDYDICLQISTDGLLDVPEVQARRGGIRSNTGMEFDSIFGSGSGFFNLTEAQVAAGTTKTCLEIPCPEFTDHRLGVTGLCLTGNILSIRGYPEFTATFTRGEDFDQGNISGGQRISEEFHSVLIAGGVRRAIVIAICERTGLAVLFGIDQTSKVKTFEDDMPRPVLLEGDRIDLRSITEIELDGLGDSDEIILHFTFRSQTGWL